MRRLACPGVVFDQVLTWEGMPGFAVGYAVAGFVPNQGSKTKPGGAERDRTVDLLNAIRDSVVDRDPRYAAVMDSVNPEISLNRRL